MFVFSVPGLTVGLATGGAVGTVACVPGAFTQAQAHSESRTSAAKIRKGGIVLRFIGIILIWQSIRTWVLTTLSRVNLINCLHVIEIYSGCS